MEGLGSRLALEVSRREIFERKNAELERINDELRVENANLLNNVEELRKRISDLEQADTDVSSDEQEGRGNWVNMSKTQDKNETQDKNGSVTTDTSKNKEGEDEEKKPDSILSTNNINGNNAEVGQIEVKIRTLKRKQKALKAELHHKTMGFQEAFQDELDLRTRIEENYDNLRIRFERLVLENEHLRNVLSNHCIDVPPHQTIGNRRPHRSTYHVGSRPPSFIPSHVSPRHGRSVTPPSPNAASVITSKRNGRNRSSLSPDSLPHSGSEAGGGSDGVRGDNKCEHLRGLVNRKDMSPPSSEVSTTSVTVETSNHTQEPRVNTIPQLVIIKQEENMARKKQEVGVPLLATGQSDPSPSSLFSSSSVTSSDIESELDEGDDVGLEHIIIEEKVTTPTSDTSTSFITQEMESIMLTTSDQLASAKAFYNLVRQRMKSESDSDHDDA